MSTSLVIPVTLVPSSSNAWALWATSAKSASNVQIATYNLPGREVLARLVGSLKGGTIICHEQFSDAARIAQIELPHFSVMVHPMLHAKIAISANPPLVLVTSANLGVSNWNEQGVILQGYRTAAYYGNVFDKLMREAAYVGVRPTRRAKSSLLWRLLARFQ